MKTIALFFAVAVLGLSTAFTDNTNTTIDEPIEIDKQVSLTGKYMNDVVYFKLLMLNESKDGVYSMVKKFKDGTMESIGIRYFHANSINVPLMYSFMDKDLSKVDVTYELYRISDESQLVQSWNYCADQKTLCEGEIEEFMAINE